MLFATPSSVILCILAYFIGYPALVLSSLYFKKKKTRGLYLYFWGVVYFLVQMHWLGAAQYHGTAIKYVYLFFSFVFAVGFYVFGYFLPRKAEQLTISKILQLSLLFVFFEYSRLWVMCGFPFHASGFILSASKYSIMLASVVGVYGLSFVVIMVSLYGAKCFVLKMPYRFVSFAILPILLGGVMYTQHKRVFKNSESMDLAIVQTGLRPEEKWPLPGKEESYIPLMDQLSDIWTSLSTLDNLDLICLPEVCLPRDGLAKRYTTDHLKQVFPEEMHYFFYGKKAYSHLDVFSAISIHLNSDILVGLVGGEKNCMFYLSQGKLLGFYVKRRLIPLGEYIPFDWLKPIARKFGLEGSFVHGEPGSLISAKWRILPTICFDEGFPGDFLAYKKDDPEVHINLSNDAWFVDSKLIDSHLVLGRMRSVENGLYSIRAGNIGVSAVISPTGEMIKHIPSKQPNGSLHKEILLESFVPYRVPTLFASIGNSGWFLIVLVCIGALNLLSRRVISVKA
jgi:apolipoprotein N-acyltransferase